MKNNVFIALLLLFSLTCFGQKEITWNDLANVTFTEKFFPSFGEYFLYPKFGENIRSLEGQKVSLIGYFLDIDPNGQLLILSKNPMASCFFCGGAGPETAVEVQFKTRPNFRTDDIVMVTGKLKLNAEDVQHFNYILTECEGLSIK